ncbi:MAG: AAA family ATPase [Firmicutes bacterium]|nr:AAA family ATPase [Bacillota bacterium]
MKKTTALHFWHENGKWLFTNSHSIRLTNPAHTFQRDLEAGKYNNTPEDQYLNLVAEYEQMNAIWDGRRTASPDFVLRRALFGICSDEKLYNKLKCTLVELASQVDFTAKDLSASTTVFPPDAAAEKYSTPAALYDLLSAHVYGQQNAKKSAAMIMYNHRHCVRSNAIFIGPTGSGKSEIWRTLASIFPEILIFDGTSLAPSGWKGALHWNTIFSSIPPELREHAVLVCDETDKIMEPSSPTADDYYRMIQNTLLKIMDGDTITLEHDKSGNNEQPMTIDCSGITVILLGAFERLLEKKTSKPRSLGFGRTDQDADSRSSRYDDITVDDLIIYGGMRREIAGRIDTIVKLQPMEKADFASLLSGAMSPVSSLADSYHRKISISDELRDLLADEAAESGLGVRRVRSRLKQMIDDKIFMDPTADCLSLDVEVPP